MAPVAVMVDAECDLPVMAFPAELTLLDGLHGYDRCPLSLFREHLLVMTVATLESSLQMLVPMKNNFV